MVKPFHQGLWFNAAEWKVIAKVDIVDNQYPLHNPNPAVPFSTAAMNMVLASRKASTRPDSIPIVPPRARVNEWIIRARRRGRR